MPAPYEYPSQPYPIGIFGISENSSRYDDDEEINV
jgi:hypothetical protein